MRIWRTYSTLRSWEFLRVVCRCHEQPSRSAYLRKIHDVYVAERYSAYGTQRIIINSHCHNLPTVRTTDFRCRWQPKKMEESELSGPKPEQLYSKCEGLLSYGSSLERMVLIRIKDLGGLLFMLRFDNTISSYPVLLGPWRDVVKFTLDSEGGKVVADIKFGKAYYCTRWTTDFYRLLKTRWTRNKKVHIVPQMEKHALSTYYLLRFVFVVVVVKSCHS